MGQSSGVLLKEVFAFCSCPIVEVMLYRVACCTGLDGHRAIHAYKARWAYRDRHTWGYIDGHRAIETEVG